MELYQCNNDQFWSASKASLIHFCCLSLRILWSSWWHFSAKKRGRKKGGSRFPLLLYLEKYAILIWKLDQRIIKSVHPWLVSVPSFSVSSDPKSNFCIMLNSNSMLFDFDFVSKSCLDTSLSRKLRCRQARKTPLRLHNRVLHDWKTA